MERVYAGLGHAQLLITGNLTTFEKLCNFFIDFRTQGNKSEFIDQIPILSDLEGLWALIFLQFKRFQTSFSHLNGWNAKDFEFIDQKFDKLNESKRSTSFDLLTKVNICIFSIFIDDFSCKIYPKSVQFNFNHIY